MSGFFILAEKQYGHERGFVVWPHGIGEYTLTHCARSATHFTLEEAERAKALLMDQLHKVYADPDGVGFDLVERRPPAPPRSEQPAPRGQGPEVLPVLEEVLMRKYDPRTSEGRRYGAIIEDLRARIAKGIETYGEPLRARNGRDPLRDSREEGLDQLLYLTHGYMNRRMSRHHWLWLVGQATTVLLESEPVALERSLVEGEWALQRAEEELDMAGRALDELRASARTIPAAEWRDAWGRLADAQEEARRAREEVAGFFASEDQNVREEG